MCECGVCERIALTKAGKNPCFVRKMKSGYVVLGDIQRFEGYALLLCKQHATELHHLSKADRSQFLEDMAVLAEAVDKAFHPDKLNYALLGVGKAQHMHWHIFPRREGDTPKPGPVWQLGTDLHDPVFKPDAKKLEELRVKLNAALEELVD